MAIFCFRLSFKEYFSDGGTSARHVQQKDILKQISPEKIV